MPEPSQNENASPDEGIEILSSRAEAYDDAGNAAVIPEPEAPPAGATAAELEEWKKKHDEVKDKLLWVASDFDNYKKRTLKEKEEYLKFSQASLLKEALMVGDNLERALSSLPPGVGEDKVTALLRQGVELTLKQFRTFLENHGVTRIQAVGEKFNPRFHQVMFQEETDKFPDETVMEELQGGYLLSDRVLRPAMVKVAKHKTTVDS